MSDDVITQLMKMLSEMAGEMAALRTSFELHFEIEKKAQDNNTELMRRQSEQLTVLTNKVDHNNTVFSAFPQCSDGSADLNGHCGYHLRRMDDAQDAQKRWEKYRGWVLEVLVKGACYGAMIIFMMGVVDWIKHPTLNLDMPTIQQHNSRVPLKGQDDADHHN